MKAERVENSLFKAHVALEKLQEKSLEYETNKDSIENLKGLLEEKQELVEKVGIDNEDIVAKHLHVKEEILNNLKKHYTQGKYPIEFDPKDYTESVYLNTHKET